MLCIPTLPRTGRPVQAGNHSRMSINVTGLNVPSDMLCLPDRKTVLVMTCIFFRLNISAAHSIRRSIGSAYLWSPISLAKTGAAESVPEYENFRKTPEQPKSFAWTYGDLSQISDNLFGIPLFEVPARTSISF